MSARDRFKDINIATDRPELQAALDAIVCMGNPDPLVTHALRRHGYGNDGWVVSYPGDWEEYDRLPQRIPEGHIEVLCVGYGEAVDPVFITEDAYLDLLSKVLSAGELPERAALIEAFRKDPTIARNLTEADEEQCIRRWNDFVPFLEQRGWMTKGIRIESPGGGIGFHKTHYSGDLEVLYRGTQRFLQTYPASRTQGYDTLLEALEAFFEYEERAAGNID